MQKEWESQEKTKLVPSSHLPIVSQCCVLTTLRLGGLADWSVWSSQGRRGEDSPKSPLGA